MFRIMFRMNGTPRAHGCAGAVPLRLARGFEQHLGSAGASCISFALSLTTCMGAKVAQYLTSGLATRTSMSA